MNYIPCEKVRNKISGQTRSILLTLNHVFLFEFSKLSFMPDFDNPDIYLKYMNYNSFPPMYLTTIYIKRVCGSNDSCI